MAVRPPRRQVDHAEGRFEQEAGEHAGRDDQPLRGGLRPQHVAHVELLVEQVLRTATADEVVVDAELPGHEVPHAAVQRRAQRRALADDVAERMRLRLELPQGHAGQGGAASLDGREERVPHAVAIRGKHEVVRRAGPRREGHVHEVRRATHHAARGARPVQHHRPAALEVLAPAERVEDLAEHLVRGRQAERAIPYLVAAGEVAQVLIQQFRAGSQAVASFIIEEKDLQVDMPMSLLGFTAAYTQLLKIHQDAAAATPPEASK